jgi:hypothetical protein
VWWSVSLRVPPRGELLWPGLIISRHEMQLISPTQKELISLQFEPAGRRGLKTIFHGAYITQSGLLLCDGDVVQL